MDGSLARGRPRRRKGGPIKGYVSKGITPEIQANLDAVAKIPDDDIDFSDAPEVTDWSGAVRGKFYRPVKQQLTLRLDADLIHWFKAQGGGRGYQTRINAALRRAVEEEMRAARS